MSKTDKVKHPIPVVNAGDQIHIKFLFWSFEFMLLEICFGPPWRDLIGVASIHRNRFNQTYNTKDYLLPDWARDFGFRISDLTV